MNFVQNIEAALVFAFTGIAVFVLSFVVIDWLTPYHLWKEIVEEKNLALADALAALADKQHATPTQLAIAWVMSRGEDIVPLIGARTRAQLKDALGVLHLKLSKDDLELIGKTVPAEAVAGTRYDAAQMAMLDSERSA